MFSVYGVSGRLFMGAASDLPQVPGVRALLRSRPVGAIGLDPSASETGENQRRAAAPAGPGLGGRTAAAYESTLPTQRRPLTQVQEVMSLQPTTLPLDMAAETAQRWLAEQGWGQAPVVNARGVLVGMLLARAAQGVPGNSVRDLMLSPVPSVQPATELRQVAKVLLDTGLPALPVVDEQGAVIGLVSRLDLLRALAHDPPLDLWS